MANSVNSIADFAATINAQGKASATKSSNDINKDQFLTMLTAQLQNQDPTNPIQNAELTSQLAQLNMVDGINQLNVSLSSINTMFAQNQALQAATLVGRTVLAPGDVMALNNGVGLAGVDLPQSVDSLQISVKDAAGNVLQTMDLGPQKSGTLTFSWDGKDASGNSLPNGDYTFSIKASAAGKAVDATALGFAAVGSVSLANQQLSLNTSTLGTVSLSQVKQIY